MYRHGLLPLSADPITVGHLELISRAATSCEQLIVLVSDNDRKRGSYLFPLDERTAMTARAVRPLSLPNISVETYPGLLVDAFLHHGCDAIFRGIRTVADRTDDEQQMRYHDLIHPGIASKVVYLEASDALRDISSTIVKAFVTHDIDVSPWVPIFVKAALEERLRHQWKIAVTGGIASGKTWVTQRLAETLNARGCMTRIINFDQLIRTLYSEPSLGAQLVREQLADLCSTSVLTPDKKGVDPRALAEHLFHPDTPSATREAVHACTAPYVMRLYREALHDKRGVILIEWAQLAEMDMAAIANHRSIVVHSPEQKEFAKERGIAEEQLHRMSAFQWSVDQKVAALADGARHGGGGMIRRFENRRGDESCSQHALSDLADAILQALPSSFNGGHA